MLVIDAMRSQPDQKVASLAQYAPILELTFDQMILDLKMKTYQDQNQGADAEELKPPIGDDGGDDPHHEIEAYKDVEISEQVYSQRFHELRQAYWGALLNINSSYDYGLIVLDCASFRSLV